MRVYNIGDRVVQPQYGPGTITSSNERHTVIDFDEHGIKTFVTEMVKLERTSEPAPVRPKGRGGARKKTKTARKTTKKATRRSTTSQAGD